MRNSNQRSRVAEWNRIGSFFKKNNGNFTVEIVLDEPSYDNGNTGAPVATVVYQYKTKFIRIPINEIIGVLTLTTESIDSEFAEAIDKCQNEVIRLHKAYKRDKDESRQQRIDEHEESIKKMTSRNSNQNAGNGLSKWAKFDQLKKSFEKSSEEMTKEGLIDDAFRNVRDI